MKSPARPPAAANLFDTLPPRRIMDVLARVPEPTVRGKYRHWDTLRHLTPPEGLSLYEWWFALKLRRNGQKSIPLFDRDENAFKFMMLDPLPERLHFIDSFTRATITQNGPAIPHLTKDTDLVRSLIEESISSSQLEGASTTRKVAKQMIREGRAPRDRSERMITNNYQTMKHIHDLRHKNINRDSLIEIQRMVTDGTLEDPTAAGRFRRPNERIIVGDDTEEVFHVPPAAEELERRIDTLCKFANGEESTSFFHPVVRAMILHFWLAYDHPFVDGNGRTARALFYWSMLRQGYAIVEFLSISQIINKAPARYGRAFLYSETDDNDLTYFLLYHTDIICRAINATSDYVERHAKSLEDDEKALRGLALLNYRQRELIHHALHNATAIFTVEGHQNSHAVSYETARKDMMDLTKRKLLRARKNGKTWMFTASPEIRDRLQILD